MNAHMLALALIFVSPFFVHGAGAFSTPNILDRHRPTDALTPALFRPAVAATRKEPLQGIVTEWTAFNREVFTNKTLREVAREGAGNVIYVAQIPVTGVPAADVAIEGQAQAFLRSLTGGEVRDGEVMFTSDVRVFDAYTHVTLSSPQHSAFTTVTVTREGAVDSEEVAGALLGDAQPLAQEQMVDAAVTTLTQRFPQARREDMQVAVENAFTKKSYRVAKNGLVLIIPAKEMVGVSITTPFHEVLVRTTR